MGPSTRIVLLTAAAAVAPGGVSLLVWTALGHLRDLSFSERAAWSAAAAALVWMALAFMASALGSSLERRPERGEDADHLGGEAPAGEPLADEGVDELVPSLDLAGLSRVADAINAEINAPPGPSLKRFLLFARPARPQRRRVHLNGAIEVVVNALRQAPSERGAPPLSFDPDPNVDRVPVDPDALHRALVNLVRNAREAAGPRGTIELRTQSLGDRVLVAVRDDGPGVPRDQLARIFQPFYTTRPGAMGLGLSICRQIAEAHGGAIFAVNILPRGLELGLELPLSRLPLLPDALSAGTVRQTT
jgi:signal transduction histidine kinase